MSRAGATGRPPPISTASSRTGRRSCGRTNCTRSGSTRRHMTAAGIDATTGDPPDGRIRRDESGRPTGMLHEGASKLVTRHAPEPTREWLATAIEAYCRGLLAYGIVAVHDLAQLVPDIDLTGGISIVRDLADSGRLPVRVHASIRTEALGAAIEGGLRSGAPLGESERARFGWLKIFGDGSLFSRTAFLLEPWEPDDERGAPPTGLRGLPTTSAAEMAGLASRAAAAGISTAIHAIGDATVRAALDALAPVAGTTPVPNRIEHLQFVDPSDIGRFHELGVVASVQPIHLRSDARWARAGVGDRAERIGYPWRTVARSRRVARLRRRCALRGHRPVAWARDRGDTFRSKLAARRRLRGS